MNSALMLSGADRIRQLLIENPIWLAPMAGVNDACFRGICKRMGAGVTYTEMISAAGLHYNFEGDAAQRLLTVAPNESPVAVQLFGSDPDMIARQAQAVAEFLKDSLAFIDINMGCPVSKVVRKGEGSALMATPEIAARIVSRTAEQLRGTGAGQSDIPVTVKFRRGYGCDNDTSIEFALLMEQAGASALAIHGRYQDQFYSGKSDKDVIGRAKEAVGIPVVGSGDIFTSDDALHMIAPTTEGGVGADGVMVARGAQGNPWIFAQTQAQRFDESWNSPTYQDIFSVMHEHATCMSQSFGPKSLVRMRKHATWYCSGLPGASHFRRQINSIATMKDLEALIHEYEEFLKSYER